MTQPDDEYAMQVYDSYASQGYGRDPYDRRDLHLENPMTQVTTKIPPRYDGRTSWFAYEEAVDDWVDVTELPKEKHGPALRNRLEGEAAVYKTLLDRDALCNAENGVRYLKAALRPHFVKGNQNVFLWRFFHLFRASRGNQDLIRWIGKFR